MILQNPNVLELQSFSDDPLTNMYKQIEFAARVCTHTVDKLSKDLESAKTFVDKLIKTRHYRALEFGTVYLVVRPGIDLFWKEIGDFYKANHWSKVTNLANNNFYYITTNYRVIVENDRYNDLLYMTPKSIYHYVRFYIFWESISRGIADEFRTHVGLSSLMESTRYCKYSADKFNNQITFIKPTWFDSMPEAAEIFTKELQEIENSYNQLIANTSKAEFAREILPLSTKTSFIQCGYLEEWKNFFNLRRKITDCNKPHPDAMFIADQAFTLLANKYSEFND